MKNLKFILGSILFTGLVVSCNNTKNSIEKNNEHSAQQSLDWNGTYSGVLPCASCEGIETTLHLNSDNTYQLVTKYIDKNPLVDTVKGSFKWEGNNIRLSNIKKGEGTDLYKIEENRIKVLTPEGEEVTGALAGNYILAKHGNALVEDKKWKLIELHGKKVEGNADTHYIQFDSKTGRAQAKANCNIINLSYVIKNEFQLRFSQGMTTLMACPDDNLEKELLDVLETTDNITTDGTFLSLNKARMAPLARFELVK